MCIADPSDSLDGLVCYATSGASLSRAPSEGSSCPGRIPPDPGNRRDRGNPIRNVAMIADFRLVAIPYDYREKSAYLQMHAVCRAKENFGGLTARARPENIAAIAQ